MQQHEQHFFPYKMEQMLKITFLIRGSLNLHLQVHLPKINCSDLHFRMYFDQIFIFELNDFKLYLLNFILNLNLFTRVSLFVIHYLKSELRISLLSI